MKRSLSRKVKIIYALSSVLFIIALTVIITTVPFGTFDYTSGVKVAGGEPLVPLDPESPWPRFRANSLQNGLTDIKPEVNPAARPWIYKTGKGIFSSPVVDAEGTAYVGSADHWFYAIRRDGSVKWKVKTGEIIDSSALLDDKGRVYVGSGDSYVYAMDRDTGEVLWKHKAHTVEEVEKEFGLETYNVNWFEGNIGMLADGSIIAPNDNYLIYRINRDTGERITQYPMNEMGWSLPAVNVKTGRIFAGSQYMAMKNVFCYNTETGTREWASGGLGSNAASPLLTSIEENGAVVLGGYDGFVRAYSQKNGKSLWKRGLREHIYASPAQLSDGTIIQPSADGTVYALEPDTGNIQWAFDTLEPIRSSPAVDGKDNIYVGSGEGRLYCINPDGTLRWSWLCIDEKRNDLNSSPALGSDGVYVAGENGGVFFIPWDYPLTEEGRRDPRALSGGGEILPDDGTWLVYTEAFGGMPVDAPEEIRANQPLAFTLFMRKNGDTIKSAIDRDSLEINVSGNPEMDVKVSAHRQFVTLSPRETWTGPDGGTITVTLKGNTVINMRRFGLKFFGGQGGGRFDITHTFKVAPRPDTAAPYAAPASIGKAGTTFEFSRLAAPNPVMLPSWNQIGFDSLHYVAGIVEKNELGFLVWTVGGKLEDGHTVINPNLRERYPLMLDFDGGLLTFYNYDGFKINFIGSWDMPFGQYRIATEADPVSGKIRSTTALTAVALGDEIEFYGRFLKLMGMTDFKTGHMPVFGGSNAALFTYETTPDVPGSVEFSIGDTKAEAVIKDSTLKKDQHVYSILLVNADTGKAVPLYYTGRTEVTVNAEGIVTAVSVSYEKGELPKNVRTYLMVDTIAVAKK